MIKNEHTTHMLASPFPQTQITKYSSHLFYLLIRTFHNISGIIIILELIIEPFYRHLCIDS